MADTALYHPEISAYPGEAAIQEFARRSRIAARNKVFSNLKTGIWIYFWLLIFEGALRKWILPELATPLLLVRDPIAIWMIVYGYSNGFLRTNFYIAAAYAITAVAFIFTMLTGHGSILVGLYGARIIIFHFPLIFLINQVFTHADVIKMGRAFLITAIVQTIVATFQFYSPQSAFINRGVGGGEALGFTGGLGYFRPPGTFSFTNGLSAYYGLVAPFVFYFWMQKNKEIKKWLLIAGTLALIIIVPISISRTLFFEVALTGVFVLIIAFRKPAMLASVVGATIALLGIVLLLSNIGFFATGIEAFTARFTTANSAENQGQNLGAASVTSSVLDRFFGGIVSAIADSDKYPFFGLGLGFGTNAATQYLTGKLGFGISEGEWGRIVGEMGVLLGMLFIILRSFISYDALQRGYKQIAASRYLPWLLSSGTFVIFIQGQWSQPTALGIAILGMGLNLAALRRNKQQN